MKWIIKTEHKREDGGTVALELESEDGSFDANVRWDGCLEMQIYSTTEEDCKLADTFHTCDLNAFIETLRSLGEVCRDFFDEGSYWTPAPKEDTEQPEEAATF